MHPKEHRRAVSHNALAFCESFTLPNKTPSPGEERGAMHSWQESSCGRVIVAEDAGGGEGRAGHSKLCPTGTGVKAVGRCPRCSQECERWREKSGKRNIERTKRRGGVPRPLQHSHKSFDPGVEQAPGKSDKKACARALDRGVPRDGKQGPARECRSSERRSRAREGKMIRGRKTVASSGKVAGAKEDGSGGNCRLAEKTTAWEDGVSRGERWGRNERKKNGGGSMAEV